MGTHYKVVLAAAALIGAAACTVQQADPGPAPFGPSDFALSIGLTANPDSISQDGSSQSLIVVTAQDSTGAPNPGVVIRLDTEIGGIIQDVGRLSARTIVTGTDGRATAVFTAPPSSPLAGGAGNFVTIIATPSGTNTQALVSRTAEIRLIPPGVILPPAGSPTAKFTVTPTPVVVGVSATFDGSASEPGIGASRIDSYSWNFGDGDTAAGARVGHRFDAAGTYLVTLTVTNDRGISASTSQSVTVQAAGEPQAVFTVSPDEISVGETAFFNASTSTAADGRTITSYQWDFGDGTQGTGASPQHVYATANTYTVTLTVRDDLGQEDSATQSVTIEP